VFEPEDRDRVHERVLALADADPRVVAGAVVGGLAQGPGDRWSDLDLTFGVADDVPVADVLDDWTRELERELHAAQLFDLPNGSSVYRVFLLPGCLQVDLSFTPASDFGARGPSFRLLFGTAVEQPYAQPSSRQDIFGLAVHHAVRARYCIERGKLWQAEYWISALRDHALELACLRRGLDAPHGRGFDRLPAEVLAQFEAALVCSADRNELLRALQAAIIPIFVGETAFAMRFSARLLDEGVFVTGFGFPVVPEGTARIRVQMSAALEDEHLDRALDAFERVGRELGLLS
jgi:hypothetical protein